MSTVYAEFKIFYILFMYIVCAYTSTKQYIFHFQFRIRKFAHEEYVIYVNLKCKL